MNNQTIYIIIAIFLIIFFVKFLTISNNSLEHLTTQSDEAIQNLASLYNKDKLTIGSMEITGPIVAVSGTIPTLNSTTGNITNLSSTNGNITTLNSTNINSSGNIGTNTIKTNRLLLGDKWILSGGTDTANVNDDWLRFLNASGGYYGGIAATKFYDTSMSNTIKGYIDSKIERMPFICGGPDKGETRANTLDECTNQCRGRGSCVSIRSNDSNDKRCLCREGTLLYNDNNWNSRLI